MIIIFIVQDYYDPWPLTFEPQNDSLGILYHSDQTQPNMNRTPAELRVRCVCSGLLWISRANLEQTRSKPQGSTERIKRANPGFCRYLLSIHLPWFDNDSQYIDIDWRVLLRIPVFWLRNWSQGHLLLIGYTSVSMDEILRYSDHAMRQTDQQTIAAVIKREKNKK